MPPVSSQRITTRVETSEPRFVPYPKPGPDAPNVLMVVLDDVGFAQLGCFGSGIATPNIDRLAAEGLRYNRFHVTSVCSATRAALLTGRNHHAVGMGVTQEAALGFPGYTGRIPKSAANLARVLRDNGYNTLAVGKWHLAPKNEYSAAGPFDRWPLGQGFERYYGFLGAETSQWAPELVRDNTHIDPPYTPEEGYHLTEDLVDQAIRMIQDQQQAESRKPFFLYFAPGAAHAPHQVTEEWVTPYVGQFDDGWEAWRQRAFDRQVAEGIIPADTELPERPPWIPDWETLPAEQRRLFARYMEVFAGFVTHTDHHLGRLFDNLEQRGIAEDTLVMVLSDNGASGEGGTTGTLNEAAGWLGNGEDVEEAIARIDDIGGQDAYNHYPYGWAWAGNAPLRLWKRYAWLGGVRTPLVVRWGDRLAAQGGVRPQFVHAVDLYATILDAAGITQPEAVDGVAQQPVEGTSLLPSFAAPEAAEHRSVQYFEMFGSRGIYHDGWMAVTDHVANQFDERSNLVGSFDFDTDRWSLFHIAEDFSEARDVADEHPELVRQLEGLWWAEAGRNQVLPLFEFPASMAHMHPGEFPPPRERAYAPGGGPGPGEPAAGADGRLRADGAGRRARGRRRGCHHRDRGPARRVGDVPARRPAGGHHRDARPHHAGGRSRAGAAGRARPVGALRAGPASRASCWPWTARTSREHALPGMFYFPNLMTSGAGLLVGRDRGLAISHDYTPPFAFTGTLERVELRSGRPGARPDRSAELRVALAGD